MTWVIEGDRKRCTRHPELGTTAKHEVCRGCIADPGPAIEQPEPEAFDEDARLDERWCRDQRDLCAALATQLLQERSARDAKDRIGHAHVAKYLELALKYHRTAVVERRARDEREHDRWLVEQRKKLARGGVTN